MLWVYCFTVFLLYTVCWSDHAYKLFSLSLTNCGTFQDWGDSPTHLQKRTLLGIEFLTIISVGHVRDEPTAVDRSKFVPPCVTCLLSFPMDSDKTDGSELSFWFAIDCVTAGSFCLLPQAHCCSGAGVVDFWAECTVRLHKISLTYLVISYSRDVYVRH